MAGSLIFCGTTNPVTGAQIRSLRQRDGAIVTDLSVARVKTISDALAAGTPVVINVPVHRQPESGLLIQMKRLGSLFTSGHIGCMILTGGDTARLVCRWLKPQALELKERSCPDWPGAI